MKSKLDDRQQEILREFIKTFLPRTATKRKNSGNEIDYVHSTLDRIFIQHFGFNLTADNILDAFQNLGYTLFTLNGVWDSENKIVKPSKTGDLIRHRKGYSDFNASFVYVEVKADTIRFLRKATASLPLNTNLDKYAKTTLLLDDIKRFKQKFTGNIQNA